MNFSLRNLSVLAYANGFTLWHYKAGAGGLQDTIRQGYFDGAADMLAGGDMMLVSAPEGGRVLCMAATGSGIAAAAMG